MRGRLRGLPHAHVGRLFRDDRTPPTSSPTSTTPTPPAPGTAERVAARRA
ncbi:hypothetical protein ACFT4A_38675 [Streptomyces sp. NPDC057099]